MLAFFLFLRGRMQLHINVGVVLGILLTLLFLQGCAGYQPKPLDKAAVAEALKPPDMQSVSILARKIRHPILKPTEIDLKKGLSADQASVMAVITNPSLRAERDRRGIAAAQLIQAGILPNPAFSYSLDLPTGGSTQGTVNAYGLSLDWPLSSLITRGAKIDAARAESISVELDIAWKEWQVAEAAKQRVYRLVYLQRQLSVAREEEEKLKASLTSIQKAVDLGDMTALDLEAAQAAFQRTRNAVLDVGRQLEQERLALNEVLGLPPHYELPLQDDMALPSTETLPTPGRIMNGLEGRRLDLLALKMGYQSQEANLRAAVRAQFPEISVGLSHARDTGNVVTTGFSVSISLPFFDRNQGHIAIEKATRQQLFDEYMNRVFEARAHAESILADMRSVERQIDAAEKTIESLDKLVRISYNGLLEGNIDALSYYNELDKLITKQLDILKLKQDFSDFYIALEITAGEFLGSTDKEKEVTGQ
jgi:outer membrane protein, heavy metal efflux system